MEIDKEETPDKPMCEVHEYEPLYGIGSPKLHPEALICKVCGYVEPIFEPTKL